MNYDVLSELADFHISPEPFLLCFFLDLSHTYTSENAQTLHEIEKLDLNLENTLKTRFTSKMHVYAGTNSSHTQFPHKVAHSNDETPTLCGNYQLLFSPSLCKEPMSGHVCATAPMCAPSLEIIAFSNEGHGSSASNQ